MLLLVAILGWIVATVCGVGWWRSSRPREGLAQTAPLSPRTRVLLKSADGTVESLRTIAGAPPLTLYRPHGKAASTRYIRQGFNGDAWVYRAGA